MKNRRVKSVSAIGEVSLEMKFGRTELRGGNVTNTTIMQNKKRLRLRKAGKVLQSIIERVSQLVCRAMRKGKVKREVRNRRMSYQDKVGETNAIIVLVEFER